MRAFVDCLIVPAVVYLAGNPPHALGAALGYLRAVFDRNA